jgi:hypothetical protein
VPHNITDTILLIAGVLLSSALGFATWQSAKEWRRESTRPIDGERDASKKRAKRLQIQTYLLAALCLTPLAHVLMLSLHSTIVRVLGGGTGLVAAGTVIVKVLKRTFGDLVPPQLRAHVLFKLAFLGFAIWCFVSLLSSAVANPAQSDDLIKSFLELLKEGK